MASGRNRTVFGALPGKAHSALLLALAGLLVTQIGCLNPASWTEETAPPAEPAPTLTADPVEELQAEVAAMEKQVADARAASSAALAAAAQAQAEADAARAEADATQAEADAAQAEVASAQAEIAALEADSAAAIADAQAALASARDKVDMMMAAAYRPSAVMIAAGQIDPGLLNLDAAQASLAGPESIYISSIRYGEQTYSALLRYRGGTTATVEQVFGPAGKLIPDSVDLSQTELKLVEPDMLEVVNVNVDGMGYAGRLRYAGDNRLEVVGIRSVTLPPSAEELVAQERAQAAAGIAEARAAAEAAVAEAETRLAAAAATVAETGARLATAEAAAAETEARLVAAEAIAAETGARLATAEAAAAETEARLVAAEAIVVETGARLATAEAAAAETGARLVAAEAIAAETGARLATAEAIAAETGARLVAAEAIAAETGARLATAEAIAAETGARLATAEAAAAETEARLVAAEAIAAETGARLATAEATTAETGARLATAEAIVAETEARLAAAEAAVAETRARLAAAEATAAETGARLAAAEAAVVETEARLAAGEAEAERALAAAQDKVDMMEAEAHRASAVMVTGDQIDPRLLNLDAAQVSLAGPESIYVSGIGYGGDTYSALLRYRGGTTATVERIFGPSGKLIPDSVDLSHTELRLIGSDLLDVANVGVGGQGYSGQLRHAGDNRLEVVGLTASKLPPTADELVAAAETQAAASVAEAKAQAVASVAEARAAAEAEVADTRAAAAAAVAAAEADAAALRAEVEALRLELAPMDGVVIPRDLDMRRLNMDAATVSVAGPNAVYVSGIGYGMDEYAVRLRHTSGYAGVADEVFDAADSIFPELDLSAPAFEAVARDTLVISNVGIGGDAYAVSFQARPDGEIVITPRNQGHRVRTAGELLRHQLLADSAAKWMVGGFAGGAALPNEGSWTARDGRVTQTDAEATHAKFAIGMAQPDAATLYGITAAAAPGARTGYGLHFLAYATPRSGNTWNYGQSYLIWITQEEGFYDTEKAHVQLYQSLDSGRLMWLNSTRIARTLSSQLTLEALFQPDDCPAMMNAASCHGSIAVFVDGAEQFKVAATDEVDVNMADTIALRTLGGPVQFLDLYVVSAE